MQNGVAYAPGQLLAVVAARTVLVLDAPTDWSLAGPLWELALDDAPVDEVLDVLVRRGIRTSPSFAIVRIEGDAVRALVRGRVPVCFERVGEPVRLDATGATTWLEGLISGATRVLVGDIEQQTELPYLVHTGVVLVSGLALPCADRFDGAGSASGASSGSASGSGEVTAAPAAVAGPPDPSGPTEGGAVVGEEQPASLPEGGVPASSPAGSQPYGPPPAAAPARPPRVVDLTRGGRPPVPVGPVPVSVPAPMPVAAEPAEAFSPSASTGLAEPAEALPGNPFAPPEEDADPAVGFAPDSVGEPVVEPAPEPVAEPFAEAADRATEPEAEVEEEPALLEPESVAESADRESVAEPADRESVAEPADRESVAEPVAEVESVAEPVAEVESVAEPVAEVEPVAGPTVEPDAVASDPSVPEVAEADARVGTDTQADTDLDSGWGTDTRVEAGEDAEDRSADDDGVRWVEPTGFDWGPADPAPTPDSTLTEADWSRAGWSATDWASPQPFDRPAAPAGAESDPQLDPQPDLGSVWGHDDEHDNAEQVDDDDLLVNGQARGPLPTELPNLRPATSLNVPTPADDHPDPTYESFEPDEPLEVATFGDAALAAPAPSPGRRDASERVEESFEDYVRSRAQDLEDGDDAGALPFRVRGQTLRPDNQVPFGGLRGAGGSWPRAGEGAGSPFIPAPAAGAEAVVGGVNGINGHSPDQDDPRPELPEEPPADDAPSEGLLLPAFFRGARAARSKSAEPDHPAPVWSRSSQPERQFDAPGERGGLRSSGPVFANGGRFGRPPTPAGGTASGDDQLPPREPPRLLGVWCDAGHVTSPDRPDCRVCGLRVPPQAPILVARPPLGVLVFDNGDRVEIDRPVILGRDPKPVASPDPEPPVLHQVQSASGQVSRTHAEIRASGWDVVITDLDAMNGTTVTSPGGAPVTIEPGVPTVIAAGARADLGGESGFAFEVEG